MTPDPTIRQFPTGATRDTDADKLDFEGFISPLALLRYAEYMHHHRHLPNGDLRSSDNWQRGIPTSAYMKSLLRHTMDAWLHHRGHPDRAREDMESALCAIVFNAFGLLHETLNGTPAATLDEPDEPPTTTTAPKPPPGYRLTGSYRLPRPGELFLEPCEDDPACVVVATCHQPFSVSDTPRWIIKRTQPEPPNLPLSLFKHFRYTGEYRQPRRGDYFLAAESFNDIGEPVYGDLLTVVYTTPETDRAFNNVKNPSERLRFILELNNPDE